jgi:trimeric autotransporter adhesin
MHLLLLRTGPLTLGLLLAIQFASIAQTEPVISQPEAVPAAAVKPQLKLRYSTDGSDIKSRGLGQVETFVPFSQDPGKSITFGEAKLNLDGHIGGNLRLGYRRYLPSSNRILGGYLGYDNRSTGLANFSQLGLGFETLGDVWDLRVNGYLPVGSSRQQTSRSATPWVTTGSGLVSQGLQFQGNVLQELWQQNDRSDRQITTVHEASLGGVEIEGGARLLRLANGGDVRAYGGIYSLSGDHSDSTIGYKFRIAAKPVGGLTMGLGVQHDAIFGTNMLFNIGFGWPNALPKGKANPKADVLARMGDGVERRDRIAVDRQIEQRAETETVISQQLITLNNPETGQPWFFNHVLAGGDNSVVGNGTAESPFITTDIQPILSDNTLTPKDGSGVVYVAKGDSPLSGFSVPGGVQVLSKGLVQQLANGMQLPGSGSGINPIVLGTVTVGSNPSFKTVLSGFDISSPISEGITTGVIIDKIQGRVEISNNNIHDVDRGIVQRGGSDTLSDLIIKNNDIQANQTGIDLLATGPSSQLGNTTISNNRITLTPNSEAEVIGILLDISSEEDDSISGTESNQINITQNTIKSDGAVMTGIALLLNGKFEGASSIGSGFTISQNNILLPAAGSASNGVTFVLNDMTFSGRLSVLQNSGNVTADGINYYSSDTGLFTGSGTREISNNTITPGTNAEDHAAEICELSSFAGNNIGIDSLVNGCP